MQNKWRLLLLHLTSTRCQATSTGRRTATSYARAASLTVAEWWTSPCGATTVKRSSPVMSSSSYVVTRSYSRTNWLCTWPRAELCVRLTSSVWSTTIIRTWANQIQSGLKTTARSNFNRSPVEGEIEVVDQSGFNPRSPHLTPGVVVGGLWSQLLSSSLSSVFQPLYFLKLFRDFLSLQMILSRGAAESTSSSDAWYFWCLLLLVFCFLVTRYRVRFLSG